MDGRGGRSGSRACRSTVLVQPSVTATRRVRKNKEANGDEVETQGSATVELTYQKKVQEVLRRFLTTDECLWKVVDEHYQNPPHKGIVLFHHIFIRTHDIYRIRIWMLL